MFKSPLKIIIFLLIAAFYGSLLITQIELPQGNDIARHVKNGELILLGNFDVLYSNVYSYTMPGERFINHHWLSGVLFYIVKSISGWEGLVVFKMLVLLAAFMFLFMVAAKKSDFWMAALFSVPAIFLLSERTLVRPEIFSIFLVAVFLYLLTNFENNSTGKRIYWLIPLQVLWVNLHIFFVLGLAIVGIFILEKLIQLLIQRRPIKGNETVKKLWIVLGLQVIACILNPNGFAGALIPFNIFTDYGFDVVENMPLTYFLKYQPLQENYRIVITGICLAILLVSFIVNIRKTNIFYLILSIITAIGAISMIRLMPFLGLIFLPAACTNFKNVFHRIKNVKTVLPATYRGFKFTGIALFGVTLICLTYQGAEGNILDKRKPGLGLTEKSENAARFFKSENLKGPIFNDYDIGGYLIYSLYPKEKVFTDNRPEAYNPGFLNNTYWQMMLDKNYWRSMLDKYQFNVLFFEQYALSTRVIQFLEQRVSDPEWSLVYTDKYAIIFLRNTPANKKTIDAHAITLQNVQEKLKPLLSSNDFSDQAAAADIFNFIGRPDLAMSTSFDIACRWPEAGKIWKVMGQVELTAQGDYTPILAVMFLDKAISEGWKTADAYSSLAVAYMKLGKKERAREALEKALKINPEYAEANKMMSQYFRK
jgi:tetratricopeptide (TPR) repeat protein